MTRRRADRPHPEVTQFLELYESADVPSFDEVSPHEARALFERLRTGGEPHVEVASVEDRSIAGESGAVSIRIYDPAPDPAEDRPFVLYFHGGGWVVGNVETHDHVCRKLADETGYPVASVEYGLAPEHPFPEGLLDCYAALEWAADAAPEFGGDPGRLVVAGDSAGATLAAGTTLLARDRDGPRIAYQVLVYPSTGDVTETDAYEENGEGYFLTAEEIAWFRDHYFTREVDEGNVYAMPRLAHDLTGLPPATVVTAGFDPLRDDGAAYADRLEAAGVTVTSHHYPSMIHGFFGMIAPPVDLEAAHDAHAAVATDLAAALE